MPDVRRAADGPLADVWSLGVIAFELLVLRRPFNGENFSELSTRVCASAAFDIPAALAERGYPSALTELPTALLQVAPERRMTLATMLGRLEEARAVIPAAEPAVARAPAAGASAPAAAAPAIASAAAPAAAPHPQF